MGITGGLDFLVSPVLPLDINVKCQDLEHLYTLEYVGLWESHLVLHGEKGVG
jgi:hypothetical protein